MEYKDRFGRIITIAHEEATPLDHNNHSRPAHHRYDVVNLKGELEFTLSHRTHRSGKINHYNSIENVINTCNNMIPGWWVEPAEEESK